MKPVAIALGVVLGLIVAYSLAHLALIELGREIAILDKWISEGRTRATRLWIIDDDDGYAWFHHGYADSPWILRLEQDPVVTVERAGSTRRYRAMPHPGPHARIHELLRDKYGVADWWVRFVFGGTEDCQAVPVRLELIED